jgi:hypothetical protein
MMDSLLFLGTLLAVGWAVIWTVMNGAHPESERAEGEGGILNARGRGKSRLPPGNLAPGNLARNPVVSHRRPV